MLDPAEPKQQREPTTLEERYACASVTSDLGLPQGDGAGAQGILAAAAWTEVHMGSALRRLRTEWENHKPRRKMPRTRAQLKSAGLTGAQAKRRHNAELVQCAQTHHRERRALKLSIPEYRQAWEKLVDRAVAAGVDEADARALAVLDRWLDDPERMPEDRVEIGLWVYLRDCYSRAKANLRQGVKGRTNHHHESE